MQKSQIQLNQAVAGQDKYLAKYVKKSQSCRLIKNHSKFLIEVRNDYFGAVKGNLEQEAIFEFAGLKASPDSSFAEKLNYGIASDMLHCNIRTPKKAVNDHIGIQGVPQSELVGAQFENVKGDGVVRLNSQRS